MASSFGGGREEAKGRYVMKFLLAELAIHLIGEMIVDKIKENKADDVNENTS